MKKSFSFAVVEIVVGLHLSVVQVCEASDAVELGPAKDSVRWDLDSFQRMVHPMQHSMTGRIPLMLWNVPLPRGDALVKLRNSGELRQAIDMLARRGMVPTVEQGWEWTPDGVMALALTLQEAGQPVNVLIPNAELVESTAYAGCPVQVEGPDATRGDKVRQWPCLPCYHADKTAAFLKGQLQRYKDAGIKLSGVWLDDESLPHAWNGCYEAQKSTEPSRRQYPPGVLDTFNSFRQWADPLKAEILTKASGSIRKMFPGVKMGNFDDQFSGADSKFGFDAIMPGLYANTVMLPGAFKDKKITQEAADDFYFRRLLTTFSAVSKNKVSGKLNIPYVSRYVPDAPEKQYCWPMTQRCYREFLRHLFLRGADSLYLFNLGFDPASVTPRQSFESVEDARSVYDELLAHRQFLDEGTPVSFAEPTADGVAWSARRCGGRCLVRTFTLGKKTVPLRISPFDGVSVAVEASPLGATYLVAKNGKIEKTEATTEK